MATQHYLLLQRNLVYTGITRLVAAEGWLEVGNHRQHHRKLSGLLAAGAAGRRRVVLTCFAQRLVGLAPVDTLVCAAERTNPVFDLAREPIGCTLLLLAALAAHRTVQADLCQHQIDFAF
jgi:hypothetical protein